MDILTNMHPYTPDPAPLPQTEGQNGRRPRDPAEEGGVSVLPVDAVAEGDVPGGRGENNIRPIQGTGV